jgi:hypothetical protein
MSTHVYHPDLEQRMRLGRPGSGMGVLCDGCERCGELAAHPLNLDREHLIALWREMVRVERASLRKLEAYRSVADAQGSRELYKIAIFLEHYTKTDPWTVFANEPART